MKAAGCETWSPFWRNLTPELVAEAHALGLKVLPWTVNDPADMERLRRGVDGIITDYPDRARRVASRSMPSTDRAMSRGAVGTIESLRPAQPCAYTASLPVTLSQRRR